MPNDNNKTAGIDCDHLYTELDRILTMNGYAVTHQHVIGILKERGLELMGLPSPYTLSTRHVANGRIDFIDLRDMLDGGHVMLKPAESPKPI